MYFLKPLAFFKAMSNKYKSKDPWKEYQIEMIDTHIGCRIFNFWWQIDNRDFRLHELFSRKYIGCRNLNFWR